MNPEHSGCLDNRNVKRRGISTQRFLHTAVPEIMPVGRSTAPKQIVKAVQHAFHQTITYQQAKLILNTLQRNDIDLEREQFRQLGALMQIMKQADPDGDFFLSSDHTTSRFLSIFICPSASRHAFTKGCLPLLVCDGTFTTSQFRQTLLFAVSLDGNNQIILLAWALVQSENEQN